MKKFVNLKTKSYITFPEMIIEMVSRNQSAKNWPKYYWPAKVYEAWVEAGGNIFPHSTKVYFKNNKFILEVQAYDIEEEFAMW